jgi:hypothetical protein
VPSPAMSLVLEDNQEAMTADLDNPYILLHDAKISNIRDLLPTLDCPGLEHTRRYLSNTHTYHCPGLAQTLLYLSNTHTHHCPG